MTASQHLGDTDLFAAELRAAITQRGLSLDRIRYHLAQRGHELSVATISYWQSGRSRPERASSIAAIAALEEILELPTGRLSTKLPARRRGSGANAVSVAEAADTYLPYLDDLLQRLEVSSDMGLTQISVHDQVCLDAQAREVSHHVKQLLVADRDGVDHFWVYYQGTSRPYVAGVHNCRLAAEARLSDLGVMVARMQLSRSLARGESLLVEHRVGQVDPTTSDRIIERAFLHQVRSAHTEVLFADTRVPRTAERFTLTDGVERVEPVGVVGRSVQALVLDFGPGLYGVRWSW